MVFDISLYMKHNHKHIIILVLTLLILVGCNSLTFDSQKWKEGNERERGSMSRNLIQEQILENKSKKEVIELLGDPDVDGEGCISYKLDLGGYASMADWSYILQICFDRENGQSAYVQIND